MEESLGAVRDLHLSGNMFATQVHAEALGSACTGLESARVYDFYEHFLTAAIEAGSADTLRYLWVPFLVSDMPRVPALRHLSTPSPLNVVEVGTHLATRLPLFGRRLDAVSATRAVQGALVLERTIQDMAPGLECVSIRYSCMWNLPEWRMWLAPLLTRLCAHLPERIRIVIEFLRCGEVFGDWQQREEELLRATAALTSRPVSFVVCDGRDVSLTVAPGIFLPNW